MIKENPETVITETKARQGRTGMQVLTVLGVSLFLALCVGLIMYVIAEPAAETGATLTIPSQAVQSEDG